MPDGTVYVTPIFQSSYEALVAASWLPSLFTSRIP
jgi:hypothetical protein